MGWTGDAGDAPAGRGADRRWTEIPSSLAEKLRAGHEAGIRAHGALPLPFEVYAMRVLGLARRRLRRAGAGEEEAVLAEVLARSALEDLYLATACEEGIPRAWEAFLARYAPLVRAVARRQGASPDQVELLAEEIGGTVLLPPARGGFRTRLGSFDGSGSLAGWLAAIVAHRLSDLRVARRGLSLDELLREEEAGGARGDPAMSDPADPAGETVARESAARFGAGLRLAWERLTAKERSALVWKYRDGLSQVEIARRLGVGPPRVSRIVECAHGKLRTSIELVAADEAPAVQDRVWRALCDAAGIHLATSVLADDPEGEALA